MQRALCFEMQAQGLIVFIKDFLRRVYAAR